MKILHFNQFAVRMGGVEAYIAEVTLALAAEGHQSHLIYFYDAPSGVRLPLVQTHMPLPSWPNPVISAVDRLNEALERIQPDIAFVHVVHHPEIVRHLLRKLPVVAYVHSPYIVCPGFAQYLRRSRRACPHSAGAICLFNAMAEQCCFGRHPRTIIGHLRRVRTFMELYQQLPQVIVASQYMRDLLRLNGLTHNRLLELPPVLLPEQVDAYAAQSNFERIIYAGRISEEKGLPQLLHALVGIDRPWRLIVAGDGEIHSKCVELVRRLGIGDRVDFLGWVDEAQMDRLYRDSSFLVVPSLWPEPYGRVGPQAMSNGRPVIAFDSGGVRDWLQDGKNGILVPANDVRGLHVAIDKMLGSPDLQGAMGAEAYASAAQRWSSSKHTARLMGIFSEAIKPQTRTRVVAR